MIDSGVDLILFETMGNIEEIIGAIFYLSSDAASYTTGQNLTVLSSQLQYNNVDPNKVQYLGIASWEDKSILSEPALNGGIFVTTSQLYQKKINKIYKNSMQNAKDAINSQFLCSCNLSMKPCTSS